MVTFPAGPGREAVLAMREVGHIIGQVLINIIGIMNKIIIVITITITTHILIYQDRRLEALYAAAILRGFQITMSMKITII